MNKHSIRRLNEVHPVLKDIVENMEHILKLNGIQIEVVQGLRTFKEQETLYAQGRTKPGQIVTQAKGGQSNHNYGLAVDVCPFIEGKPQWNSPIEIWATIGRLAESYGLEWGGNWKKFVDKPHIQIPLSLLKSKEYYNKGGLQLVWKKANFVNPIHNA